MSVAEVAEMLGGLKVPSVVVPVEFNFAFNPAHPDFSSITIGEKQPFSLDPRVWNA